MKVWRWILFSILFDSQPHYLSWQLSIYNNLLTTFFFNGILNEKFLKHDETLGLVK